MKENPVVSRRFYHTVQTILTVVGLSLFITMGAKAVSQAGNRAYVDGQNRLTPSSIQTAVAQPRQLISPPNNLPLTASAVYVPIPAHPPIESKPKEHAAEISQKTEGTTEVKKSAKAPRTLQVEN